MKLKTLALAAAAVCAAGPALALDAATVANAATLKYYVSGASALSAAIGGLFNNPTNCQAGTVTTYTKSGTAFAGTIYSCSLAATNVFGLAANTNVAFQKRDEGGSAIGVYPVSTNSPIQFIDPATCTGPASGTGTCSGLITRTADGGISDLEPSVFAAAANTPSGFGVIGNQFEAVRINSTIFGLAVSNALYTQLQADQGTAGQPTVSQAVIGQMLGNTFLYDPIGWSLLLPNSAAALQTRQVTICRRTNGSGTQAGANRFFLEYPYNSGIEQLPLTAGDTTTGTTFGNTAGKLLVVESSSSGGVPTCLTAANTASSYAIGHLSLETAETATWKFVKIGGQTPSRDEAKAGRYPYFFESSCQISTAAPTAARDFVRALCTSATAPANLNLLSAAAKNGVMANPEVCPATFGTGTPEEVTFCSRVTRNGNSAQFPTFAK